MLDAACDIAFLMDAVGISGSYLLCLLSRMTRCVLIIEVPACDGGHFGFYVLLLAF